MDVSYDYLKIYFEELLSIFLNIEFDLYITASVDYFFFFFLYVTIHDNLHQRRLMIIDDHFFRSNATTSLSFRLYMLFTFTHMGFSSANSRVLISLHIHASPHPQMHYEH